MWIAELYLYQKSSLVMRNLSELGGGNTKEGTYHCAMTHVKLEIGSQMCIKQQLSTSKFKPKNIQIHHNSNEVLLYNYHNSMHATCNSAHYMIYAQGDNICMNYICQMLINCMCVQPLVTVQYIWQYQKFKITLFILPSMPKLSVLNL